MFDAKVGTLFVEAQGVIGYELAERVVLGSRVVQSRETLERVFILPVTSLHNRASNVTVCLERRTVHKNAVPLAVYSLTFSLVSLLNI